MNKKTYTLEDNVKAIVFSLKGIAQKLEELNQSLEVIKNYFQNEKLYSVNGHENPSIDTF